jgi:hypothetical protein
MLDTFGFPTPQGSNYQEFYGGGSTRDWLKPRGASMVRMLLIGAGGGGGGAGFGTTNGCNGGGSAAVTQWIGPAIFIPDELRISLGAGGSGGTGTSSSTINAGTAGGATTIVYQAKDGTGYTLLTANGGGAGGTGTTNGTAGASTSNNFFGASGIFSSVAGQASDRTTNITASSTIFLTAGSAGQFTAATTAGRSLTPAYGYPTNTSPVSGNGIGGYFLTQPIMLGCGGSGGSSGGPGGNGGRGGIGCGGGGGGRAFTSGSGGNGGRGGDGAVFIWSW